METSKENMQGEKQLDIIFVRHAHSCGNAKEFSDRSKLYKLLKLQTKNPNLSNLGLMQIGTALEATNVHNLTLHQFYQEAVDHVYCSDFLRACETALLLFPQRQVSVVPYVGEKSHSALFVKLGLDLENAASSPSETLKYLHKMKYPLHQLDYDLYETIVKNNSIPTPSVRRFLKHIVLQHWMNSDSPFYLFKNRDHVRVAIVTHGHFMRDFFGKETKLNWKKVSTRTAHLYQ